jgi:hypothetical protein
LGPFLLLAALLCYYIRQVETGLANGSNAIVGSEPGSKKCEAGCPGPQKEGNFVGVLDMAVFRPLLFNGFEGRSNPSLATN